MGEKSIRLEIKGAVAEITLLRSDVLNSFNAQLRDELLSTLQELSGNPMVRAVLLTGSGRGFSAGQDLAELKQAEANGQPLEFEVLVESYNEIVRTLCLMPKPVVCALNGVAAGAGANLALACDFVIASDKASFVQSFVHVGLVPDSGGSFFLPRLVGLAKAKELVFLGEKISAPQALELGLIYRVFPEKEFLEEARKLAGKFGSMPTVSLGLAKRALHESVGNNLFQQLEIEKNYQTLSSKTSDYREGMTAFLEKRKPQFKGK